MNKIKAKTSFQVDDRFAIGKAGPTPSNTAAPTAIGDLDCNGEVATWTVDGTVSEGNPTTKGPSGTY